MLRPVSWLMRGVAVVAAAALLSGCASDKVPITDPTGADRAACAALIKALPDTLDGQLRRPVDPDDALGAAWGDPPFVLRCGVGKPEGYDPTAGCDSADGVDWFIPDAAVNNPDAEAVLTTMGRSPAVELRVPAARRPPAGALVDLAATIKAHTTSVAGGCH